MTNRARIAVPILAASLLGVLLAPVAVAAPPAEVLERARQGVALGRAAVEDVRSASPGDDKATGLERATAAIDAAAARKAERTGQDFPGNGRALGRGHAAAVHEYLARGLSPSELLPHGDTVSSLARALEQLRGDHPGRGQGLDKERPVKGDQGDAEGDDAG
jgi:hypothetical protein